MSQVKGAAFASRIQWVLLNHGNAGLQRLCSNVSTDLKQLLEGGATMASWYPFDLFIEFNVVADKTFGTGDFALVRAFGRHGADANLRTIYRLFYKVGRVKWILARAARLWTLHYDSGQLLVSRHPGKEVRSNILDFATPHALHCLAIQGWMERSIELSGGNDVVVEELSCRGRGHETCECRLTWS